MKTLILLSLLFTVGCGDIDVDIPDYSEDPETGELTEGSMESEDTPSEDSNIDSEDLSEEDPQEVSEEVPEELESLPLLRKGLTMDEVASILGEPDDSGSRAGLGRTWFYEMDSEKCKVSERFSRCSIYFDGNGRLDYVVNIKPEYKDHRIWE